MSQTILEIYLDDIITWASDDQELVDNLHKIFQRLREKNITLNPEKCKLGLNEIEYVGHVINEDGLTFSKQKLSEVQFHKSLQEDLPSFVQMDASNYGIGAYLFQKSINASTDKTVELPIAFLSKTLNKTQLRWSTYEKEVYATFFALTKWEHYLRDVHFTLKLIIKI